jgi:hypothetical protein
VRWSRPRRYRHHPHPIAQVVEGGLASSIGRPQARRDTALAYPRIVCVYARGRHGRSGPAAASPMGRPMVSAGDEVAASLLPDSRQPTILGCTGKPAVPLSYGGSRLRAWHTGPTSTTFCRSDDPKRLGQEGLIQADSCMNADTSVHRRQEAHRWTVTGRAATRW